MTIKRNFWKKTTLILMMMFHIVSFAAPAKKTVKKKRARTQTTGQLLRPDLKIVSTVAKPVLFASKGTTAIHKSKLDQEAKQIAAFNDPREALYNDGVALNTKIPQIDWPSVASKLKVKDGRTYLEYHGLTLLLTIDPNIQSAAERYLNQSHGIVSGSTAIIEPQTGRLLALAQGGDHSSAATSVSSRGPAASLMKIITSAAAIEKEDLDPSYEISFRGGCGVLARENWIESPGRDNMHMPLDHAFGASCNTFFARLALYHVGLSSLSQYAEKFMFNRPIPSDIKIQTSLFLLPDAETATPQEIAEAGSGFGATKLSPIHAALLSAAVANGGIMMAPYLIEAAYDSKGNEVFRTEPTQIGRVVSERTAEKLSVLMLATTSTGTSRRVFHKRGTQAMIDDIGGKTGTLLDLENREILYTWFSGIAFMSLPENISIGTVIASPQNYVVRANAIAQTTIAEYLRLQKLSSR